MSSAVVRFARDADVAAIRDVYAPAVLSTPISFELDVPSVDEMRARLHDVLAVAPWLVVEDGGTVVGYAYGAKFRTRPAYRWAAETTVYVRDGHHRRGVGAALYETLLDLLRRQGFRQAIGVITIPNAASVGLHERFGFRRCGLYPRLGWKLGAWHDVGSFELALQTLAEPPPEPRLLPAIRGEAPFRELEDGRAVALR